MALADLHSTPAPADLQRPRDEELDLFGLTHPGKVRPENQDHFLICTVHPQVVVHATSLPDVEQLPLRGTRLATAVLVADGVGGSASGSDASRLATEAVTRYVSSTLRSYHAAGAASDKELLNALRSAAFQAHDAVRAEAATRSDPKPMATTLTLALAIWPWLYVVQVGDSRCYYWDGAELHPMTRDQTIAQQLVDQGALPAERLSISPFRHVLSSAIGGDEATPVVSHIRMRRQTGGHHGGLLLCSDGLTKHVTDVEIGEHMRTATSSEQLCRTLLDLALERGGSDNITIAVARAPLKS
jgi:serine/threonine protein phosphatase PrpC